MQLLLHVCHFLILSRLTKLPVQKRDCAAARASGPGSTAIRPGNWLVVVYVVLSKPSDGSAMQYWLTVELGVVPGTIGPGCCSPPIAAASF